MVCRLLLTGDLHEDGLADFFDGFGGGTSKKDSSIGSYRVTALVIYFLLYWSLLSALVFFTLMAGEVCSKGIAAQLVNVLPYARKEEESKAGIIYKRMSTPAFLFTCISGMLPLFVLLPPKLWPATLFPLLVFTILYKIMKQKVQGYTGDCCGAAFLLCELAFYLGVLFAMSLT
jgi:adenosylcobinamide-GDP ribazoletransferase